MKKLFSLIFAFALVLSLVGPVEASSLYKYNLQFVDENGKAVVSDVYVRVATVNTVTDASVWPQDDNVTCGDDCGTLTGAVTPDTTTGSVLFWSTATSHDVFYQHGGQSYVFRGVTPGSDRRLFVLRDQPLPSTQLDQNPIASAADLVLPHGGNFFRVTGTTNINRISETGQQDGRRVMLLFAGTKLGIGQSGNVLVPGTGGTLNVGAGTLLDVVFDGTTWRVLNPGRPATSYSASA